MIRGKNVHLPEQIIKGKVVEYAKSGLVESNASNCWVDKFLKSLGIKKNIRCGEIACVYNEDYVRLEQLVLNKISKDYALDNLVNVNETALIMGFNSLTG